MIEGHFIPQKKSDPNCVWDRDPFFTRAARSLIHRARVLGVVPAQAKAHNRWRPRRDPRICALPGGRSSDFRIITGAFAFPSQGTVAGRHLPIGPIPRSQRRFRDSSTVFPLSQCSRRPGFPCICGRIIPAKKKEPRLAVPAQLRFLLGAGSLAASDARRNQKTNGKARK